MKNTKTIKLGKFKVESGVVRVSDPCYDRKTWCAGTIDGVKKGEWVAEAISFNEGEWGNRIGYLIAFHKDYKFDIDKTREVANFQVGVDSGQAGIYDDKYFKDDKVFAKFTNKDRKYDQIICPEDVWYSWNCDKTLVKPSAGIIPFGCVSSSGYGDGGYECSFIKEEGKVVAIVINYGLEEENGNEEDEENRI